MKAIFCKECKFNNNGWCYKYRCNGKKRTELCYKYKDDEKSELDELIKYIENAPIEEVTKMLKSAGVKFKNDKEL